MDRDGQTQRLLITAGEMVADVEGDHFDIGDQEREVVEKLLKHFDRLERERDEARDMVGAIRDALVERGHCGDGGIAFMVKRALDEARERGRESVREAMEDACTVLVTASAAFPEDWTGSVAERAIRAVRERDEHKARAERLGQAVVVADAALLWIQENYPVALVEMPRGLWSRIREASAALEQAAGVPAHERAGRVDERVHDQAVLPGLFAVPENSLTRPLDGFPGDGAVAHADEEPREREVPGGEPVQPAGDERPADEVRNDPPIEPAVHSNQATTTRRRDVMRPFEDE